MAFFLVNFRVKGRRHSRVIHSFEELFRSLESQPNVQTKLDIRVCKVLLPCHSVWASSCISDVETFFQTDLESFVDLLLELEPHERARLPILVIAFSHHCYEASRGLQNLSN